MNKEQRERTNLTIQVGGAKISHWDLIRILEFDASAATIMRS